MRKWMVSAVAMLAAVMTLVPFGARAEHCASDIVVFSRVNVGGTKAGGLNPNALVCIADLNDETLDTRLLLPAAAEIRVRYTGDLGAAVPSLTATLNGLGFEATQVTLTRSVDPNLEFATYDTTWLEIPAGALAPGAVTVTIVDDRLPTGEDTVCFHTIDAAC